MRILFVNTNQAMQPYPVFPIGLCSMASAAEKHGHESAVLDLCFVKDTEKAIREKIASFQPELIGVGIRNLDNSDLIKFRWFLPEVKAMVDQIRRYSSARLVLGGAAVSVLPKAVLEYLDCDLGIIGDGEHAFINLIEALEQGKSYIQIPGVIGRIEDRWFFNPKKFVTDYDLFGQAQVHRWIKTQDYLAKGSIFPIQSNRGCAFSCIYCTYTQIEGKRYRLRPEQIVAEEIAAAKTAGIDYFEFVDSVFNVPESHAKSVCKELIRRDFGVRYGAAGMNPKWLSDEFLDLMEEAGFDTLDVTIESASPLMIRNLKKGFEHSDVIRAAKKLAKRKMKIIWIFLLGGPGETTETVQESLDFMKHHIRPTDYAYITFGLRIYPGTPLAETAMAEKAFQYEDDLIRPTFYLSDQLDLLKTYFQIANFRLQHPNILASFETGHPLVPLAYAFLRAINAKKPYWRYGRYLARLKSWASPGSTLQMPQELDMLSRRAGSYFLHEEALS